MGTYLHFHEYLELFAKAGMVAEPLVLGPDKRQHLKSIRKKVQAIREGLKQALHDWADAVDVELLDLAGAATDGPQLDVAKQALGRILAHIAGAAE